MAAAGNGYLFLAAQPSGGESPGSLLRYVFWAVPAALLLLETLAIVVAGKEARRSNGQIVAIVLVALVATCFLDFAIVVHSLADAS